MILFFISALAETNRPRLICQRQRVSLLRDTLLNIPLRVCTIFYCGVWKYNFNVNACSNFVFCGWLPLFDLALFEFSLWLPLKVSFILFLFIAVRASVPRYRFDQLMYLG